MLYYGSSVVFHTKQEVISNMRFFLAVCSLGICLTASAVQSSNASNQKVALKIAPAAGTTANTTAGVTVPPSACDKPGVVSLAGEVILRIHSPAGGKDCQQRADAVTERIVDTLGTGLVYPENVTVKYIRREWAVFVKDILVITADAESARMNSTTTKKLAEAWAKNLRRTIPASTPMKPGVSGGRPIPGMK